ncbi:MAG: ribokinase [Clostridia bacterium]|nr:ribokinase [Clostridia bacterium]
MRNIYVVGSVNTDLVIKAPYMPVSGETLTGEGFFTAHGGKGANQAVAAARLGGNVIMCACVGDDTFGKSAIEGFKADGIDTQYVRVVKNMPSGTAMIIVVDGDNRIILDKGANGCLTEQDIDQALENAQEGDIYLTQLENPIEIIGYGLKKAKEKGMYVILNPAPANKEIKPYLGYCDLITPNETEVDSLGGREMLLEKVGTLLVTLGGDGFEILTREGGQKYPCISIKPVDTTAAGDTFCGGLVTMLAEGKTLEEAAKFGSKAASIACTRQGAQPSIPTRKEVERYEG